MITALLVFATVATNRIVPGVSLGDVKIGALAESLTRLGRPYSGDTAMQKAWATWLGKGAARLDIFTSVRVDQSTIRLVRATSPSFRTAGNLGPGVSERRIRRAFPRAKSVGTYRSPEGGPPVYLFDDVRGGLAFEVGRGRCLAVAVHEKGKEANASGIRSYLAQRLTPQ